MLNPRRRQTVGRARGKAQGWRGCCYAGAAQATQERRPRMDAVLAEPDALGPHTQVAPLARERRGLGLTQRRRARTWR
jgi:hypothetical protein